MDEFIEVPNASGNTTTTLPVAQHIVANRWVPVQPDEQSGSSVTTLLLNCDSAQSGPIFIEKKSFREANPKLFQKIIWFRPSFESLRKIVCDIFFLRSLKDHNKSSRERETLHSPGSL